MPTRHGLIVVTDTVPDPCYSGACARLRDLLLHLHEQGREVHVLLQRNRVEWQTIHFLNRYVTSWEVAPDEKPPLPPAPKLPRVVQMRNGLVFHLSRSPAGVGALNAVRRAAGRPPVPFKVEETPAGLTRCSAETRAALAALTARVQPSAILVVYGWMAECVVGLETEARLLLDTIDVVHQRAERLRAAGEPVGWAVDRAEETRLLSLFDTVIAIQPEEAETFRQMAPGRQVITVGTTFARRPAAARPVEGRVLLVGGQNAGNTHGLRRLMEQSWPQVRRHVPEAELHLCGSLGAKLRGTPPGVTACGYVPDLLAEYDQAAVVLNPIWVGTGLKIKTVEALCYGKALVTTAAGIEGMAPAPTGACRVCADSGEVAAAVVELLRSPAERQRLEQAAAAYAAEWLLPEKVYAELDEVLEGAGRT